MKITPNNNTNNPKNRSEMKVHKYLKLRAFPPLSQGSKIMELPKLQPNVMSSYMSLQQNSTNTGILLRPAAISGWCFNHSHGSAFFRGGHIIQEVKSYIVYTG